LIIYFRNAINVSKLLLLWFLSIRSNFAPRDVMCIQMIELIRRHRVHA